MKSNGGRSQPLLPTGNPRTMPAVPPPPRRGHSRLLSTPSGSEDILTGRSVPKGPGRQGSSISHRLSTSCPIGRPGQYSLGGSALGEQPCSVYKCWEAMESTVVECRERIKTELRHSRHAKFSLPQRKPRHLIYRYLNYFKLLVDPPYRSPSLLVTMHS